MQRLSTVTTAAIATPSPHTNHAFFLLTLFPCPTLFSLRRQSCGNLSLTHASFQHKKCPHTFSVVPPPHTPTPFAIHPYATRPLTLSLPHIFYHIRTRCTPFSLIQLDELRRLCIKSHTHTHAYACHTCKYHIQSCAHTRTHRSHPHTTTQVCGDLHTLWHHQHISFCWSRVFFCECVLCASVFSSTTNARCRTRNRRNGAAAPHHPHTHIHHLAGLGLGVGGWSSEGRWKLFASAHVH